jgi:hypothetical protein
MPGTPDTDHVLPQLPCAAAATCCTTASYSDAVTYGELFLQNEFEMSCYNLDQADVAEQRKRFALYEAEVRWTRVGSLRMCVCVCVCVCVLCRPHFGQVGQVGATLLWGPAHSASYHATATNRRGACWRSACPCPRTTCCSSAATRSTC